MRASTTIILVPLDTTADGEACLALAAGLAMSLGARLRLFHVITPATSLLPLGEPAIGQDAAPEWAEATSMAVAQAYLDQLVRRLDQQGIAAEARLDRNADIAAAIVAEARRSQPLLIAMAAPATAGHDHWLRESIHEQVCDAAPAPLLLCRAHSAKERPAPIQPRQIAGIVDGGPADAAVLGLARSLAAATGAAVHLIAAHGSLAASTSLPHQPERDEDRSVGAHDPVLLIAAGPLRVARKYLNAADQSQALLVVPQAGQRSTPRRSQMLSLMVPLDGSAEGEQALAVASALAQRAGATITLAHVHVPILNVYMGSWNLGGVPIVDDTMDLEQREREQEYLNAVRARLGPTGQTVSCILLDGPVASALARYAETSAVDLVVMTTHGKGPFSRLWLGSVADGLIRHCCVPTLLVRPSADGQVPDIMGADKAEPATILLPLDGSELGEQIMAPARALGTLLGAEYHLLRIVEPVRHGSEPGAHLYPGLETAALHARRSTAQAYLKTVAADLRRAGLTVHTHVEITEQPAQAILAYAERHACTVIALATHGYGGIKRLVVGSVADKIVRGAETPVLVLHPRSDETTAEHPSA